MLKKFGRFFLFSLLCSGFCDGAAFVAKYKIYIDEDTFKANTKGDEFYIHVGNNVWLVTHSIHRDHTGMFTYEENLAKSVGDLNDKYEYEKKWKCPYCDRYWPIGKPCNNQDCPSKYK